MATVADKWMAFICAIQIVCQANTCLNFTLSTAVTRKGIENFFRCRQQWSPLDFWFAIGPSFPTYSHWIRCHCVLFYRSLPYSWLVVCTSQVIFKVVLAGRYTLCINLVVCLTVELISKCGKVNSESNKQI